jgi:hypothetical protein
VFGMTEPLGQRNLSARMLLQVAQLPISSVSLHWFLAFLSFPCCQFTSPLSIPMCWHSLTHRAAAVVAAGSEFVPRRHPLVVVSHELVVQGLDAPLLPPLRHGVARLGHLRTVVADSTSCISSASCLFPSRSGVILFPRQQLPILWSGDMYGHWSVAWTRAFSTQSWHRAGSVASF